jgi:o-succinylbenzoate---CoA ligase
MADPLTHLQQRRQENWLLIGSSPDIAQGDRLAKLAEQRTQELHATDSGTPPTLLLTEPDPLKFLAGFLAACTAGCPIFLGNPNWVAAEWQQVWQIVQPDLCWGNPPFLAEQTRTGQPLDEKRSPASDSAIAPGWIMIPTGGSSGKIRFVVHTWETLIASVQGFQQYFQLEQINSCCVLPLYHVSGLMQLLRSFTSGGRLAVLPFKTLEAGQLSEKAFSDFCLSLVPTQLQRLMHSPESTAWLKQFQIVLLGGAPAWTELLDQARQQRIRLAPTYGMTETASQIATLKPDDFLQGHNTCGQILPHLSLTIRDLAGQCLPAYQVGKVTIQGASLALGYYGDRQFAGEFQPDDLGFLDDQNQLNIVGRDSRKIITGGENVFPGEVEAAMRSTGLIADVCVIGVPDPQWGEAVTAIYVPQTDVPQATAIDTAQWRAVLTAQLSKFKQPKHFIALKKLPHNAQGKLNYEQLKAMAIAAIQK